MAAKSLVKMDTVFFKEWITTTVSMTETDILLQKMGGCNQSGKIIRPPLKNLNAWGNSSKKRDVLNKYLMSKIICSI